MARRPLSPKQRFHKLVASLVPSVRAAFHEAVAELTAGVDFPEVVRLLEAGNIEDAILAMYLEPAAFQRLYGAIINAYGTAGREAAASTPTALKVRFNDRDVFTEILIAEHAGKLVQDILDETKDVIRKSLTEAFSRGDNPRKAALDIIGRIDRFTGRREGGLIGLTDQQADWVRRARFQLENLDRDYLRRKLRDKRFDRTVIKAIRDGKQLAPEQIDKMISRYTDKLLRMRGETIALNETFDAINQSRMEFLKQNIRKGAINPEFLEKIWHTAGDSRVRDTHRGMNGQVKKFYEPFVSPSGVSLDFPHDPKAPASETIRCRCWLETRINYARMMKAEKALRVPS